MINNRKFSWRSYTFLTLSILVTLSMILLDPIAVATSEQVGSIVMIFILAGTVASIILAILVFSNKAEKKNIAMTALPITLINIAVIGFFLWFGANFVP